MIKIQNSAGCIIFANEDDKSEQVSVSFINELRDRTNAIIINNGEAYDYTDRMSKIDDAPAYDASNLGGLHPKELKYVIRPILLEIKIYVRKYEMAQP